MAAIGPRKSGVRPMPLYFGKLKAKILTKR